VGLGWHGLRLVLAGLDSRDMRAKVCVSVHDEASLACDGCVMQDSFILMRLMDSARASCHDCSLQYADTGVALHHCAKSAPPPPPCLTPTLFLVAPFGARVAFARGTSSHHAARRRTTPHA
jgi:hypothetical protein